MAYFQTTSDLVDRKSKDKSGQAKTGLCEKLDRAQILANEHWAYIKSLFEIHDIADPEQIVEFHYKAAMIHGYKHGVADCERAAKSQASKETMD